MQSSNNWTDLLPLEIEEGSDAGGENELWEGNATATADVSASVDENSNGEGIALEKSGFEEESGFGIAVAELLVAFEDGSHAPLHLHLHLHLGLLDPFFCFSLTNRSMVEPGSKEHKHELKRVKKKLPCHLVGKMMEVMAAVLRIAWINEWV